MTSSGSLQLVSIGEGPTIQYRLNPPAQVVIGRSRESDLVIDSPSASRQHAQLYWEPRQETWVLVDLGSRGGTTLNGQRAPAGRPCAVKVGDRIGLPELSLVLRGDGPESGTMTAVRRVQISGPDEPEHAFDLRPVDLAADLDETRLSTLLNFSRRLNEARDEADLFVATIEGIREGTAFEDAAVVSCLGGDGVVDLIAASGSLQMCGPERFSRTLLRKASEGQPARFLASASPASDSAGSPSTRSTYRAESLIRQHVLAAVCAPLSSDDEPQACLYVDLVEGEPAESLPRDLDFVIALAQLASIAMSNLSRVDLERRFAEARAGMFEGTVRALASAIDAKDPYTRGHSDRVSWLSATIARTLDLSHEEIEQARVCGQVHDVGKIGVPEAVLTKPSGLSDEEFEQVKRHPDIGYRILKDIPAMRELLGGVRHHHERFDGDGYPDGLAGDAIPLLGRLVAVADAFDAMRSARAYREGRDTSGVLEEVRRCSGSHFDPVMAEALLASDLSGYEGMLVTDST